MIWIVLLFAAVSYGCSRIGVAMVRAEEFAARLFQERERRRQIAEAERELEDFKAWQKLEAEWQDITDHFVEMRERGCK